MPYRPDNRLGRTVGSLLPLLFLAACGAPAYPDDDAVRERFQMEYRNAKCELAKIHAAKRQPDHAGYRIIHVRIEARCKSPEETLVRKQIWQLSRERPTLLQGAWRWEPGGEISD